jgi:hypothetical protein
VKENPNEKKRIRFNLRNKIIIIMKHLIFSVVNTPQKKEKNSLFNHRIFFFFSCYLLNNYRAISIFIFSKKRHVFSACLFRLLVGVVVVVVIVATTAATALSHSVSIIIKEY